MYSGALILILDVHIIKQPSTLSKTRQSLVHFYIERETEINQTTKNAISNTRDN